MRSFFSRIRTMFGFRRQRPMRKRVMAHFRDSLRRNAELYRRLAK